MIRLLIVIVALRNCFGFSSSIPPGSSLPQSSLGSRDKKHQILEPREVCDGCSRPLIQCLCDHLPSNKISLNTHVLVLQHPVEFRRKTISTTPLLKLVLEHVQVLVGRSFDKQLDSILLSAMAQNMVPLLLFPGPDAITLEDPEALEAIDQYREEHIQTELKGELSDGNKYLLIIVDGTWTQARRMVRYSPILMEKCQQIQFTSTAAATRSIYDPIRKQPDSHCLSTLESCSRTLTLLEPNNANTKEATKYLHSALKALVCIQIRQERIHLTNNPGSIRNAEKIESKRKRQQKLESDLYKLYPDDQNQSQTMLNPESIGAISSAKQGSEFVFKKEIGDGFLLRNLEPADASFVDSRWPYRSKKSMTMIERQIRADNKNATIYHSSCCLGIEKEEQLVACILRHRNGSLGILHVDESYRRQGFATTLLSEASASILSRGEPLSAYIVDGNKQSEAVFQALGWVKDNPLSKKGTGKRRSKRKWIKNE